MWKENNGKIWSVENMLNEEILANIRSQMHFKWSKRTFWNPGQLTLVVDWPNVKFSEHDVCDFVKMLGKFPAFPMTK